MRRLRTALRPWHPAHAERCVGLRRITLSRSYGRNMTEKKWLTRMIFLETVAGVPGMVGAMTRHLHSLRRMDRDRGWISLLLGEAENERMHLMTFVEERKSTGIVFRTGVLVTQGVAWNLYFLAYLISPRGCHSFVGYLEEEAVRTYTKAIAAIDEGSLPGWTDHPACPVAKKYWGLPDDATFRDVLVQVRADEAVHCKVNHVLSESPQFGPSPFGH